MPDDTLISLAERKQLHDPKILREQTERLLGNPKAEHLLQDFTDQWLDLRDIDSTTPDSALVSRVQRLPAREHARGIPRILRGTSSSQFGRIQSGAVRLRHAQPEDGGILRHRRRAGGLATGPRAARLPARRLVDPGQHPESHRQRPHHPPQVRPGASGAAQAPRQPPLRRRRPLPPSSRISRGAITIREQARQAPRQCRLCCLPCSSIRPASPWRASTSWAVRQIAIGWIGGARWPRHGQHSFPTYVQNRFGNELTAIESRGGNSQWRGLHEDIAGVPKALLLADPRADRPQLRCSPADLRHRNLDRVSPTAPPSKIC